MRPIRAIAARAWIGLAALGVLTVLLSLLDLAADTSAGLPSDHRTAFLGIAGSAWSAVRATGPGSYVTTLEEGYAIHELAFGLLFLLVAAVPLRRGERWAWVASWTLGLAVAGYAALLGSHDATILQYATVELAVFVLCMLSTVPRLLGPKAPADVSVRP